MQLKSHIRFALLGSLFFFNLFLMLNEFFSFSEVSQANVVAYKLQDNSVRGQRYAIDTQGCKIPEINPFDESIGNFTRKPPPFHCPCEKGFGLTYLENDSLKVNSDILARFPIDVQNQTEMKDFHCCVLAMYRYEVEEEDNFMRYPSECVKFTKSIPIMDEYLKVECFLKNERIHETYYTNLVRKPMVEERCTNAPTTCPTHDKMGVIILFLDSVSRINFRRNFPKSRKILLEEMQAIEMHGYNRVADNTFPNLVALLAGLSEDELRATCWTNVGTYFDNCTFIWRDFADEGFRTAFVEDFPDIAAFNLEKRGFQRQPTDYYGHNFLKEAYKVMYNRRDCLNEIPETEVVFKWCYDYMKLFRNDKHFGLFATSRFTHRDDMNMATQADPILKTYLRMMRYDGLMNNTFLFIISDHGARFGEFRETPIGGREVNLPMFYIVPPVSFAERFPQALKNLADNAHRLTTAYDLHETLRDILDCRYGEPSSSNGSLEYRNNPRRQTMSLFRRIPDTRKCLDIGIPLEYCACYVSETKLVHDSEIVQKVYHLLIDKLNNFTEPYRELCAVFVPDYISRAREVHFLDSENSEEVYYEVTFGIEPGLGMFQGIVMKEAKGDSLVALPEISRLDVYGNSSACISQNSIMRKYCHCI